ncbi:hypothetical protein O3M35_006765 [Rhynocoris fuscipes]|uniref:Serine-threonine/tyrosine-protein kinase catalytic domain-containing protein n=1 Tax=Rhynocoris fuscipes TaxID=488301 RepID=A0AAW1DEJ5_9HEMI
MLEITDLIIKFPVFNLTTYNNFYLFIFLFIEIVESVKNCSGTKCLRPSTSDLCCDEEVSALMKRCWAEDPADRPDFNSLKATIRKLNK